MARVTYGPLITELAGSIGGITFQRNSSGSIARLKPNMPVNPSEEQQLQQIKVSQLIPIWSSLSDANKLSWEVFAAAHDHVNEWSETKQLNGFQWFMSCNLNLLVTSQNTINTAPGWTAVPAITQFTMVPTAISIPMTWADTYDFTGYRSVIYATPPMRQSSLKLRKSTFLLKIYDSGVITTYELITFYESIFNVVWADIFADADCTVIFRIKKTQEATGLAGPFTSLRVKIN